MARAFAQTGRSPREVDFIELHATGMLEFCNRAPSLTELMSRNGTWGPNGGELGRRAVPPRWRAPHRKCEGQHRVGSSISPRPLQPASLTFSDRHLEITSFLASLCKVTSMFSTGLVPPNANYTRPNPAIRWKDYKFRVPTAVEPLRARADSGRALVAMTSSGIGGANGHAVVEAPPVAPRIPSNFWIQNSGVEVPVLLIAGGLSPRSAQATAEGLQSLLQYDASLNELARHLGRSARSLTWRSFAVATKGAPAVPKFSEPAMARKTAPPLVFVFSGQGTQYWEST